MNLSDSEKGLVTLDRPGTILHHDTSFEERWNMSIGQTWAWSELVDLDPDKEPELLVPYQQARYDLRGWGKITEYVSTPIAPGMGSQGTGLTVPAIGDFTGDGETELIFTGSWEWQAFRADGEMIARYTVVDQMDQGQRAKFAHREGDRTYAYHVTGPITAINGDDPPDEPPPHSTRLQKVSLVPTGAALAPGVPSEAMRGAGDPRLPFQFQIEWTRDFPAAVEANALLFYDLNGDGTDELVVSHANWVDDSSSAFTILDLEGNQLYSHPWPAWSTTGIGDMNGDGVNELVASLSFRIRDYSDDPYARVMEPGTWITGVQWNGESFDEIYRFQAEDYYGGAYIVLCDVNGDGADEVLLRTFEGHAEIGSKRVAGEGKTLLLNGTGEVLWEYLHPFGAPYRLIIDDFTGDAHYELMIGTVAGQILVFSPSVEPSAADYETVLDAQMEWGWLTEEEVDKLRSELGLMSNTTGKEGPAQEAGSPMGWVFPSLVVVGTIVAVGVYRWTRGR